MELDLNQLNGIKWALDDVIGYLGDNSCGDPDCCGGPFYHRDQFDEGVKVLAAFGLTVAKNLA